ncbi:hypothetical protein BY996DRAFT_8217996 [Phakopsora pachyrhizi]|nr:hypothetical protein BY996DRAFT_8217996 [Phakopsora pachyrhizi]
MRGLLNWQNQRESFIKNFRESIDKHSVEKDVDKTEKNFQESLSGIENLSKLRPATYLLDRDRGRVDLTDDSIISAAFREANEEIGLPIDDFNKFTYLTTLEPFVSRYLLIVYPVICLYHELNSDLIPKLSANQQEVSEIFSIPLKLILNSELKPSEDDQLDRSAQQANSSVKGKRNGNDNDNIRPIYSFEDFASFNNTTYRHHSFQHPTMPSRLSGLTADVVLTTLVTAYQLELDNLSFGSISATGQISPGGDRQDLVINKK